MTGAGHDGGKNRVSTLRRAGMTPSRSLDWRGDRSSGELPARMPRPQPCPVRANAAFERELK
jgi:hypothetical protein